MTITKKPQRLNLDVVFVSDAKTNDHLLLTLDSVGTLLASDNNIDFNVAIVENRDILYEEMFNHIEGNIKTVHYDFKFNYNKCLNLGASKLSAAHILFCNNDLIFHRDSIRRLFKGFGSFRSVSPYCNLSHPTRIYNNPTKSGNFLKSGHRIGSRIAGWCIGMERSLFDEIGGFDEDVDFYYSDNIYADQLISAGVEHALVCNSFVDHLKSMTLKDHGNVHSLTSAQKRKYNLAKQKYAS